MMKTSKKFIALLSVAALLTSSTFAQTVATDPVGYVTVNAPSGGSLQTNPLIGNIQYSGAAGTVSGVVLSLSGLPASVSVPSYVHVTSGSAAGSTASIISSDATSVTLEGAIAGVVEGDSVRIVEHFTLADLTAASSSSIADESTVTVYNSDTTISSYVTYANIWYDTDGFAPADDVIVHPSEGVVLGLQSPTTLIFTGNVNTKTINASAIAGSINIMGTTNPSAPSGVNSLGSALAGLQDESTITVYSGDGALTPTASYVVYSGVWYDTDGFAEVDVSVAAPSAVVVSAQATATVTMPAAYSN
jgi:uncharacterized protein YcfL